MKVGFIKRLFGSGKSKSDLIRDLAKHRISSSPLAISSGFTPEMVDSLSGMQIASLPEAGIVANVETYSTLKRAGTSDNEIFQRIEAHRSRMVSGSMPAGCDLRSYIKYRVHLENATGAPVSDESIDFAIDEALKFVGD